MTPKIPESKTREEIELDWMRQLVAAAEREWPNGQYIAKAMREHRSKLDGECDLRRWIEEFR